MAAQTESSPVTVRFFGGLGEIGANMAAVELDGRILLIDVGLTFPDAEHYGIDLILPDWSELRGRAADIAGVVITHGHEDHVGALPFFLREFGELPVFASRLTCGLIDAKLTEHAGVSADLRTVEAGDRVREGPFDLEFVGVTHSIPDGFGLAIHTPQGTILHSGDFKLDQTPIDSRPTDLPHLAELGDAGVDLLLADSTNADTPGHVPTERSVGRTLHQVFDEATGRIVVTTFASHIHRVQQALDAARDAERVCCFIGRSMLRNMPIARELGYLTYDDADVVDLKEVEALPPERIALICTGSQGEPFAALSLMAAGRHKQVRIEPDDTVVMASSVIPGNESAIYRTINGLTRQGARVVHKGVADIHVSGHAAADELQFFHNIVRPRAFVPVHGEYRHMAAHADIAVACGLAREHTFVCEDGDSVVLEDGRVRRGDSFDAGRVFVDGLGVGDVGDAVLRDRGALSSEGVCVSVLTLDSHARLVGTPQIVQQGVIGEHDGSVLLEKAAGMLEDALRAGEDRGSEEAVVRRTAVETLRQFWREETGRRPVILPVLVEL